MCDKFTIVFKGDIRAFDGNPLHVVSPFGEVVAVGVGDEFAVADALRAENARLKEALKPFAELKPVSWSLESDHYFIDTADINAARAAMGESDEN